MLTLIARLIYVLFNIANLAMALASQKNRRRVGLLDLDLFGPSVPKLMGLESNDEPDLTPC